MMNAIIIEDEINNLEFLEAAINKFTEGINIIGKGTTVKEGISLINTLMPDLVFLDIELPDGNGFDILNQVNNKNINVIFTTAFENYALKSYRFSAIDYLLKPLNIDELIEAIERAKLKKENQELRISFLQEQINEPQNTKDQIIIDSFQSFIKIQLSKIIAFVSETNSVCIILEDDEKIYTNNTLTFYENLLDQKKFLRIHRSHIINLEKIHHVDKGRTGFVKLSNNNKYEIAARRKPLLLESIKT